MTQLSTTRQRVQSIDVLRGIVIVIMAIDHVRDFFYQVVVEGGATVATGPTDLATTTPELFFTRWITHFCAPIFVFLAGTSAYLMGLRRTKAELSRFLISRGIILILIEAIIITFGWTFNPFFNVIIFQVIWAIGISMLILGLLIWLPIPVIFLIGAIIVFGHNLLDKASFSSNFEGSFVADLMYYSQFSTHTLWTNHIVLIVYSFVPWLGVMLLGYCFGTLYKNGFDPQRRKKILVALGFGLLILFIVLRLINRYGDPVPWSDQPRGQIFSFLSFINLNKYPPSLDFLAVMIGGGMLMLALLEGTRNKLTAFFNVFGRVPLFFYILHFYLIHLMVVIVFFVQGYPMSSVTTPGNPFYFRPSDFGFGLLGVYIVWILVVAILYPLCKKFDRYKTANVAKKKWLSYM